MYQMLNNERFNTFIINPIPMKRTLVYSLLFVFVAGVFIAASKPNASFKLPKVFGKSYAAVPEGTVVVDGKSQALGTYYTSRGEVSNLQYRAFLESLRASGDMKMLAMAYPDTVKWNQCPGFEEFADLYHTHPAYAEYPVVNISYEAAVAYCSWLTNKINSAAPEGMTFEVRLPTRVEWVRAAEGSTHQTDYAWGGPYVRNAKGCFLCNCRYEVDSSAPPLKLAKHYDDKMMLTAPVYSYYPNSLGIYNMNGNVAEMINEKGIAVGGSWASTPDKVKNHSSMRYEAASPQIGFRPVIVAKSR